MNNYVFRDGRLDWEIDGVAYAFSKEVTGSASYYDPERITIEKGAKAVLKHVLKRLRNGEEIPVKPTKAQAGYGMSEAMVKELTRRLWNVVDEHVGRVEQDVEEARAVIDLVAERPAGEPVKTP